MAILFKAYKDADGVIHMYEDGGEQDVRAAADSTLTRSPGNDKTTSNDENTNETPIDASFVQNLATAAAGAAPVQDVAGKTGNVVLNSSDVGLGNVDNTSDADKPVSTAQQAEIDTKYDASNPNGYETPAELNTRDSNNRARANHTGTQTSSTISDFTTAAAAAAPVQSVAGKTGAVTVTQGDVGLGNVDNTSDANKPVSTAQQAALDLKYDASNPSGFQTAAQVNSSINALIAGAPGTLDTLNEIATALGNDPNFATTITNQITGVQTNLTNHENDLANPHATTATQVGLGNVDNTSDADKPVSTAQQAALDLKYDASNPNGFQTAAQVTTTTSAAITAHEAASDPHAQYETSAEAQAKVDAHANLTTNPHSVTQAQVGLGNVDNTSDANKPVSTAQQAALDLKANSADVYTQVQLDGGILDTRYFTETEINSQQSTQDTNISNNTTAIGTNATAISTETTNRVNADTALQGQIDTNDTDILNLQNEQTTQDAAIALNTAKVSADGPVSSHSDVNTTGAVSGDLLGFNGTTWGPQSILNGFTIFPIWAEENGGLSNNNTQWSYGNGATGNIGIVIPFECELFALTINAEGFGTSVSIDVLQDGNTGTPITTQNFTAADQFQVFTAITIPAGSRIGFRTNTEVGAATDVRVCAWFRVRATAAFPTPERNVVSGAGIAFSAATFQTIPGMSTNVTLTDVGTVDGIVNYSALRSGATNSITEFRIVINGNNGQSFFDTLSTFNDNGSAAHFVTSLPAGTYTVEAQCMVDQPITITSIALTATAVED